MKKILLASSLLGLISVGCGSAPEADRSAARPAVTASASETQQKQIPTKEDARSTDANKGSTADQGPSVAALESELAELQAYQAELSEERQALSEKQNVMQDQQAQAAAIPGLDALGADVADLEALVDADALDDLIAAAMDGDVAGVLDALQDLIDAIDIDLAAVQDQIDAIQDQIADLQA